MDWLVRSPDLKFTRDVFGTMRREIANRNPPPHLPLTIQGLKAAFLNEWDELLQELMN